MDLVERQVVEPSGRFWLLIAEPSLRRSEQMKRRYLVAAVGVALFVTACAGGAVAEPPGTPTPASTPDQASTPAHTDTPEQSPNAENKLTDTEMSMASAVARDIARDASNVVALASKATYEEYFETYAPDIQGAAREDAANTAVLIVSVRGDNLHVTMHQMKDSPPTIVEGVIVVIDAKSGAILGRSVVLQPADPARDDHSNDLPQTNTGASNDLTLSAFDPVVLTLDS